MVVGRNVKAGILRKKETSDVFVRHMADDNTFRAGGVGCGKLFFFSKSCKSCLSHTEICRTFTNPHVYTEQGMDEKSRERGGCISSFINHHIPLLLTKIQEHNRLRLMWQNFSGKRFHIFRNERKWSLSWLSGAISWCI